MNLGELGWQPNRDFASLVIATEYRHNSRLLTNTARTISSSVVSTAEPTEQAVGDDEKLTVAQRFNIWWLKPNKWRDDVEYVGGHGRIVNVSLPTEDSSFFSWLGTRYVIRRGDRIDDSHVVSDTMRMRPPTLQDRVAAFPLFTPSFGRGWDLAVVGTKQIADEQGLEVSAKWMNGGRSPTIWPSLDSFRLVIHLERGIVLSYSGLRDNNPVATIAASAIFFDVAIDESVFSPPYPSGTKTEWVS